MIGRSGDRRATSTNPAAAMADRQLADDVLQQGIQNALALLDADQQN